MTPSDVYSARHPDRNREIVERAGRGESMAALAREYKISAPRVKEIVEQAATAASPLPDSYGSWTKKLMPLSMAGEKLGRDASTMRKWCRSGYIECEKLAGRWWVSASEVKRMQREIERLEKEGIPLPGP